MKEPKYTDLDRYKHGYTPSGSTDIRATLERAAKRIEEEKARDHEIAAEKLRKTINLKRAGK